ncbi:MAG TPA: hypothetical protein VKZ97_07180 [Flavobacteriaceae bacterium]|nr:hypothetical protein [Flavobacteriaceae bacterium]
MKTIFKTVLVIGLLILFWACNKEDDSSENLPLGDMEFVNETLANFTGDPGDNIVTLYVDTNAIVVDPTKVFIELNIEYPVAGALDYAYKMPFENAEFQYLVGAVGGNNEYIPENTLRFNPNHENIIESSYPDSVVPSGDYNSATLNAFDFPVETPLFGSMMGKNIQGEWQFNFPDYSGQPGSVHKIKLVFEEGALQRD